MIAGIWAIRRIAYERPFQSLVGFEASSKCSKINENLFLLHVQIIIKNEGHAVINYGDSDDLKYRSTITMKGIKNNIQLPGKPTLPAGEAAEFITRNPLKSARFIPWNDEGAFVTLFDGPFNELFQDWFWDPLGGRSKSVTLEGGESEQYSCDCLVSTDIAQVSIAVTIFETVVKDKKLGRPYYWSIEDVFPLKESAGEQDKKPSGD